MSPSPEQPADEAPSARRRLLVVQSQATLRLGFAYALNHPANVVETAESGTEALERASGSSFDLIFLDLRMPGMDGIRVVETLRQSGCSTPVVLCTALHHPNATWQAISLGVVDFLLKPASPVEVRGVVEFILGPPRSRLAEALRAARSGDPERAILRLGSPPEPDSAETCWLKALRLTRELPLATDQPKLEEELRCCFPLLAFNGYPLLRPSGR